MSKIKLSDYIAKRLKEHYHVEHIFMVTGGGAMHLNDSLGRYIPYTVNNHEQACSMSAEGYARVNQKLAVVNVTTGPGGLNCLNGVFGQWTDSVPVLYISGQVKRATMLDNCKMPTRQVGDQEVDIVKTVKHLTKYAVCVKNPEEIKYHLDRAVYEATTGRKGPCWIDIPIDVQASIIEENDLVDFRPNPIEVNDFAINDVVEKIKTSKRPLIIAGHGIRLSEQIDNFYNLIENLQIPVVTTFNGFDLMEDENPLYVGRIGTIGQRAGNFALQNADLLICLGTRNNVRQVSYNWENFGKNAYKIVVDIDKAELEKPLVEPDLKICADLKDFIPEFLKNTFRFENEDWKEFCKSLKEKYSFENEKSYEQKSDGAINPYYFTRKLTEALAEDDIFVMGNGSSCVCPFQVAKVKRGQRYILNSGNASMGFDLPASIGAYYASKGRRVVCYAGDGSILMNIQELQTVAFNKIPVKIFVINNNGYSSIRQTQRNFFEGHMTGSGVESGVGVPDFKNVAEAFGIKSVRIDSTSNLEEQIKEVLNYDGAILCEIMTETEYSFTPKLSSRKLEDGTMISATLEDMSPFLPREEFNENMIVGQYE